MGDGYGFDPVNDVTAQMLLRTRFPLVAGAGLVALYIATELITPAIMARAASDLLIANILAVRWSNSPPACPVVMAAA